MTNVLTVLLPEKELNPGLEVQTDAQWKGKSDLSALFSSTDDQGMQNGSSLLVVRSGVGALQPRILAANSSLRLISDTSSSCSMLPREKGGVVDNTLKVYGTDNLRVVDLSILPLQVASHLQSLCYLFETVVVY